MRIPALFLALTAALAAQQPQIENARVVSHAFTGTLDAQLTTLGAGPFWAGYSVPVLPGHRGDGCWTDRDGNSGRNPSAPVRLEGSPNMLILIRVEAGKVDKLQLTSPDCRLDGGNLPFHWFNGISTTASVNWLKTQATGEKGDRAMAPLALHVGPDADKALDELTATSQPDKLRERAAFWLGNARGKHGLETLKHMLATDPSLHVREQVVFALANSKEPEGMATVMDLARNDKSPQIRSKALFWIAQKAATKDATQVIGHAITDDPERSVKEQAVFALKTLPSDQGIPLLITVAKSNPDPAIRKKAMFWLGQSKDTRTLDFFAQVLRQ